MPFKTLFTNSASSQLETGKSFHVKPVLCAVTLFWGGDTIMCWLLAGVSLASELPPISLLPWSLVFRHLDCYMPLWGPEKGCHGIPANSTTFSRRWCQRWKRLGRMTLAVSPLAPVWTLCKVCEDKESGLRLHDQGCHFSLIAINISLVGRSFITPCPMLVLK